MMEADQFGMHIPIEGILDLGAEVLAGGGEVRVALGRAQGVVDRLRFHQRSNWTTWEAAVRFRPEPPAFSDSTKKGRVSSSWKRRTRSLRSCTAVAPVSTQPERPKMPPRKAGHRPLRIVRAISSKKASYFHRCTPSGDRSRA